MGPLLALGSLGVIAPALLTADSLRSVMKSQDSDIGLAYLTGLFLLVVTGWVFWDYYRPEWKEYQAEFQAMITERFGEERAQAVPTGLQQIWVPELDRVDRCVTCHLGVEWEGMEDAPNPFRAHPPGILQAHNLTQYGCTVCHGGQGFATDLEGAHATSSELHWEDPLLYTEIGQSLQVESPTQLLEIKCNICHRYEVHTEGAEYINYAKQLVEERRCALCHKINGQGSLVGPDLTYVGDQSPEHYDYTNVPGKLAVFNWHMVHFRNPRDVAPESVMPNFNFGPRETQALTMLVMSWKRTSLPAAYIPPPNLNPPAAPEEPAAESAAQ